MIKQLLVIVSFILAIATASANNLKPVEGDVSSPPLKLNDMQGHSHDLSDYKGKVVLVQFWGTYCPPCRKEMPSMNRLQEKMGETPFAILAVNMGEPEDTVKSFIDEVKPEFTVLLDPDGTSIGDWKIFAAPSNFIVAPDGKIHYTLYGGVEWDSDELVSKLKELAAP
jgi:thiol-disulfide isomerase/thioredoxin